MSEASGPRTEVTITGILSCVDADGGRPLTYDEFVDFVSSAADHLHDDGSLIDPIVSGQASTGELSISFGVLVPIGAPELTGRLSEILDNLNDALGLVWPHDPVPLDQYGCAVQASESAMARACPERHLVVLGYLGVSR